MLKFSQKSMDLWVGKRQEAFVEQALQRLQGEFPELWLKASPEQLKQALRAECDRAARFQIHSADGIYLLFTSRLRLHPDFPEGDDFAWARTLLGNTQRTEPERIAEFEGVLWGHHVGDSE
ncbi:MAG: hypothetical protein E6Q92_06390 [Burkholderiaceae bacterium]|nr:MAG: hypothetical protein E6Q92_06390 [Burkholderiaceae bacterium]